MLDHGLQLRRGEREQAQAVVEPQAVLEVELADLTGELARRRVGRRRQEVAVGVDHADGGPNAATVLDRHDDRRVIGLGFGQVGVGAQVAEVRLLGPDLAAAAVQEHRGLTEDVAVLG